MSLMWMDGFDTYGPDVSGTSGALLINNGDFNTLITSSGYSISNGVRTRTDTRTGYGKSLILGGKDPANTQRLRLAFVPKSEIVMGFAFKYEPTDLNTIVSFLFDDRLGHVDEQLTLYVNAQSGISAAYGASNQTPVTLVGATPPNVIFPNVWQYIEIRYRPDPISGSLIIKIDGQECFVISNSRTSRTIREQLNLIDFFVWSGNQPRSGVFGSNWYDDLYILDTLGSGFNSFLGDVVVHSVSVVSDGGTNELSQFGGGVGHYTAVNQLPPDGDTSYLYGNTSGATELFGLAALPDNIIDVLAMSVHIRGRKDAPGLAFVEPIVKYSTHAVNGAATPLAIQYLTKNMFAEQCPDGTAWTKAKAEATLVGFEVQ